MTETTSGKVESTCMLVKDDMNISTLLMIDFSSQLHIDSNTSTNNVLLL